MQRGPRFRSTLVLSALCVALAACAGTSESEVTHHLRPLFSPDAETTPVGAAEVSTGAYVDLKDRYETPSELHVGVLPSIEVFAGWSPYLDVDHGRTNDRGIGDVVLGAKWRFADDVMNQFALAFEPKVKLATADDGDDGDGLGTGETDYSFALRTSRRLRHQEQAAYFQIDLLGDPDSSKDKFGYQFGGSASYEVTTNANAFGEIVAIFVPEDDKEFVFVTMGSETVTWPDLVFDGSISAGITPETPDFVVQFGVTKSFGR